MGEEQELPLVEGQELIDSANLVHLGDFLEGVAVDDMHGAVASVEVDPLVGMVRWKLRAGGQIVLSGMLQGVEKRERVRSEIGYGRAEVVNS